MVEITNTLKHLGKCFFYPIETTEGFLSETKLEDKTHVRYHDSGFYDSRIHVTLREYLEGKRESFYSNKAGQIAKRNLIIIGKDYKGSLKIPRGTEAIQVFDLNKDNSQVIQFCHRFKRSSQSTTAFIPFANEMRSPDNRIEIEDIVKTNIRFERTISDEEEEKHSDEIQGCF